MSPPESHYVHVVPNQPSGRLHVLGGIRDGPKCNEKHKKA